MGTSFDWSREVVTCDPAYYKWTQWLFLQFFKKGLVYRRETAVNWCPSCKTVLANEQVVDGKCERCSTEVMQRQMLQWNIKITDYADRLVDDLDALDWPEQIKESQRNWIGRSEGAEVDFFLDFGSAETNARVDSAGKKAHLTVFTTRIDTLYGATYLVLAPEHPLLRQSFGGQAFSAILQNKNEVEEYIEQAKKKTEIERLTEQKDPSTGSGQAKTGIEVKGVQAINPATGEKIPLYVADYVLGHYGTGAVMGVPAHDERDFEFAKKYNVEIRGVLEPLTERASGFDAVKAGESFQDRYAAMAIVKHPTEDKYLCLRWQKNDLRGFVSGGIESGETAEEAARREITEETGYKNPRLVRALGQVHTKFYRVDKGGNLFGHFQGFLFELEDEEYEEPSKDEQLIHKAEWVAVDDVENFISRDDMKILWSRINGDKPYSEKGILVNSNDFNGLTTDEAKIALTEKFGRVKTTYKLRDWIVSRQRYWGVPIPIIHCEKCGAVAVEDSDLPVKLPDVEDYLPEGSGKSPLAKAEKWVRVKCPQCKGDAERETDTLDTFVDSSWYFLRYTDPKNDTQFADAQKLASWMPVDLYSGGAEHTTMHVLYSRFWQKAMYDLGLVKDTEPYQRRMNRSLIMGPDGQKMSKSKGNVIDPDEVVERLGADTVRMYLAFIGPYSEVSSYPWNPDGVVGVRRFLERVWRAQDYMLDTDVDELGTILHQSIKKVGEDITQLKFNTAIAQMMIFLNKLEKVKKIGQSQWQAFLILLAPFAPHIAEELWHEGGNKSSVHIQAWPDYDPALLVEDEISIAIQINGKTRGEIRVAAGADKAEIEQAAREAVAMKLQGKSVIRTILVPGRLVNFVVGE